MLSATHHLKALPAAVYTTDAEGRITFYNDAAAELWGHRPELGSARWCGSWRLFWPDGRPMRHDECPMAIALKEGRPVVGMDAVAERPDGTCIMFMPYPNVLRDDAGRVTGAINLLIDITDRKRSELAAARLAAIVSSSDDAIISKTLDGTITSWNAAATRILGYSPEEMIGQSIRRIIPAALQQEEDEILSRLKRGERIEHFDTERLAKDGRLVDVSLTISPIRDSAGRIVGASKIARDVTERKQSEELQRLLFEELNHRVKNTLATIEAIANHSMRNASNPSEFVASFNGRVQALARAHDLLVQQKMKGASVTELVRDQVVLGPEDEARVSWSGPDVMLDGRIAVQLALVLHELATNARKYGALSVPMGALSITWDIDMSAERELHLKWHESGVPNISAPRSRGFGTTLIERSLEANQGEASIRYEADGVKCGIRLPLPQVGTVAPPNSRSPRGGSKLLTSATPASVTVGKRVLLIEDEPLVAMEIEEELKSRGWIVLGPASHVEAARRLIAQETFDAALLDANLRGHPVDELAAALARKGVPFAFATGCGRGALPAAFRDADMLAKPFDPTRLVAVIERLLSRVEQAPTVVPLRPRKP